MAMTDEEIIKALECISICDYDVCSNDKCPYYTGDEMFPCNDYKIAKDALDLIKRLKAQNKEFDEKIVMQMGLVEYQKAEIERLRKEHRLNLLTQLPIARKIKAEAIKEFADELKNCFCVSKEYLDIMNIINNLVKEMVGDQTEEGD